MKQVKRIATLSLICCLIAAFSAFASPGSPLYTDSDTGNQLFIDDHADLLSEEEEERLLVTMTPITAYGNAAFVSGSHLGKESVYREYFGKSSGTVLIIDMGIREITLYNDGGIYKRINNSYAASIVDNAYRYASRGNYYGCANTVFTQVSTILEGGRIAQPMRYITNALASLVLALTAHFLWLWLRKKMAAAEAAKDPALILGSLQNAVGAGAAAVPGIVIGARKLLKTRKVKRETSSGGSSGGGVFGGGGGGFSGGGASHRF